MFTIGDTSGLVEAKNDKKKNPIKVIGDIVDDMAKKCEDVPKKMLAPSKVIEVTNGCFSSAQVITVSDEMSGGDGGACAAAASTGGGCGGGRSSTQPVCPSTTSCGKKSSCGGSSTKSQDPCSGQRLCSMVVPSTIDDIINSDYSAKLNTERQAEQAFRNSFCVYRPYKECASCPHNIDRMQTQERDISKVFEQINMAIQTLIQGNYSLATNMFECPGQIKSLMNDKYRVMAEVAVPSALSVLTNLSAARGALDAFEGIATAAEYTDFRREVMYAADKLFRSGAKIGIPKAFTDEVGKILTKIGCSPNTLVMLSARALSARDTRYGEDYNLYGSRCCGKNRAYTPYKSEERRCPSPISVAKATAALKAVRKTMEDAKRVTETPTKIRPITLINPYVPTKDKLAKPEVTYYKRNTDTGEFTPVEVKVGEDLEIVASTNGPLFVVMDTGIKLPEPTEDTVAVGTKEYFKPVRDTFVPLRLLPGDPVPTGSYEKKARREIVRQETPVTPETKVKENAIYVMSNVTKGTSVRVEPRIFKPDPEDETKLVEVYLLEEAPLPDDGDVWEYVVFDIIPLPPEPAVYYTGDEACLLDDGILLEDPVTTDADSLTMAIDTQALVTKTIVLAGEMSTIEDLGLSEYEVKMAYILDSEFNGSVLPDDVDGRRIPTILDALPDD